MPQIPVPSSRKHSAQQSRRPGKLRVIITGPELIADSLNEQLICQHNIDVAPPLPDVRQVIDVVLQMRELQRPVDVVVLCWNGNASSQERCLRTISELEQHQQACLVLVDPLFPEELEQIKRAGARGYIFTTVSFLSFVMAIRQSERVRHDLSQRVYQFLGLLAGRTVNSRFLAFQVLLEYSILEYASSLEGEAEG